MTTRHRVAALAMVAGGLAAGACEPSGGPSHPAAEETFEPWQAGPPEIRLGSVDGNVTFTRIVEAAPAPEGRIHVLDQNDAVVRRFTADGAPAGSVGRKGEGPGEFDLPTAMGFLGDTLWVVDRGHERMSLFSSDGALLGDHALPRVQISPEEESSSPVGLVPGGRLLVMTEPGPLQNAALRRFPLLALDRRDGGHVDTLATLDREHVGLILITLRGRGLVAPGEVDFPVGPGQIESVEVVREIPFPDFTIIDATPSGDELVLVDRAVEEGDEREEGAEPPTFTLTRIRASGDTVFSVRRTYDPVPVDPRVTDSIVASYTGRYDEADVRRVLFLPPTWPPVHAAVAAADGQTWVGREAPPGAETRRWEVFDGAGRPLAAVELPAALVVHHATPDALWGVVTDELDVPYLLRIPVGPAPSGNR